MQRLCNAFKNPMRKTIAVLAVVLLATALSFAQGVAVTAHLVNGQGQNIKTAYLHFELWNCGKNVPQVIGQPLVVVPNQFDMHADPTTGLIAGNIYGNNEILCGTEWLVTVYKGVNLVGQPPQYPREVRCLAADQYKGSPVVRQVFAVPFLHSIPLRHLRAAERLGLFHSTKPILVEQRHQFLRLRIGHRPQAHQYRFRASFLQCAP